MAVGRDKRLAAASEIGMTQPHTLGASPPDRASPRNLFDFSGVGAHIVALYNAIKCDRAGDRVHEAPGHFPLRPSTIPDSPLLPVGTRILVAAEGTALDKQGIARFLEGHKNVFPDLVLVHTGAPGAESIAGEWAERNDVPQIIYAPDPAGETAGQRSARHEAIFTVTAPERIYDLSAAGNHSELAELARQRNRPVVTMQAIADGALDVVPAGTRQFFSPPAHRVDTNDCPNQNPAQTRQPREEQDQPTGTHILITGAGKEPNIQAFFELLYRLSHRFPDLVVVHTNEPGTETVLNRWATNRDIPQVIVSADPAGETSEQRRHRHNGILDRFEFVRIYDFTEPGQRSELADLARERNFIVSESRSAVEKAPSQSMDNAAGQTVAPGQDMNMANRSRISHSY